MSIVIDPSGATPSVPLDQPVVTSPAGRVRQGLTNPVASGFALLIGILWTIPTVGLLVQSFRGKHGQDTGGLGVIPALTWSQYQHVATRARNTLPSVVHAAR